MQQKKAVVWLRCKAKEVVAKYKDEIEIRIVLFWLYRYDNQNSYNTILIEENVS